MTLTLKNLVRDARHLGSDAKDLTLNTALRGRLRIKAVVQQDPIVCQRCGSAVIFATVSPGYFAVCPEHDEDLYAIETMSRSAYIRECNS